MLRKTIGFNVLLLALMSFLNSCEFNYRWNIAILGPENNSVITGSQPIVPRVWGKLKINFNKENESKDKSLFPVKGNVFCNGVKGTISKETKNWVVENVPLKRFDSQNLVCTYTEPQYSTMDKRTIKYMLAQDGVLLGSKSELYLGDTLFLSLQDQQISSKTIPAFVDNKAITLNRTNDNSVQFLVLDLAPNIKHKITFTLNGFKYSYEFKVNQFPTVANPEQVVDNYRNSIVQAFQILSSELSQEEFDDIKPNYDEFLAKIDNLTNAQKQILATYLFIYESELNRFEFLLSKNERSIGCSLTMEEYWTTFYLIQDHFTNMATLEASSNDIEQSAVEAVVGGIKNFIGAANGDAKSIVDFAKESWGFVKYHFKFIDLRSITKVLLSCAKVPKGPVFSVNGTCTKIEKETLSYRSYEKTKDEFSVCARTVNESDILSNMKKPSELASLIRRLDIFYQTSFFKPKYDAPVSLPQTSTSTSIKGSPKKLDLSNYTVVKKPLTEADETGFNSTFQEWVKAPTTFAFRVSYFLTDVAVFGTNFTGSLSSQLQLSITFLLSNQFRGVRVRPDCNPKEGLTYTWDWGDGSKTNGFLVTHQYAPPQGDKTYTIKVIAINDKDEQIGNAATTTVLIPGGDKSLNVPIVKTGIDELCAGDPMPTPTPDPTPGD